MNQESNMDPTILALGAGSLALSGINSVVGTSEGRKTREMQERLFNQQLAYNERMVNQQNEYNTPLNQKNRLIEAGMNPHIGLFKGNATIPSGVANAPSAPNMQNPYHSVDPSALMNMANIRMQEKNLQAQIKLQERKLDIDQQRADTDAQKAGADIDLTQAQRDNVNAQTKVIEQSYKEQLDTQAIRYRNLEIEALSKELTYEQQDDLYPILKLGKMLENENIQNMMKNDNVRVALQAALNGAQIDEIRSRTNLNAQEYRLVRDTYDARVSAAYLGLEIQGQQIELNEQGIKRAKEDNSKVNKALRYTSNILGVIGQGVNIVSDTVDIINPIKPKGK